MSVRHHGAWRAPRGRDRSSHTAWRDRCCHSELADGVNRFTVRATVSGDGAHPSRLGERRGPNQEDIDAMET